MYVWYIIYVCMCVCMYVCMHVADDIRAPCGSGGGGQLQSGHSSQGKHTHLLVCMYPFWLCVYMYVCKVTDPFIYVCM